jgi:hypothetical protein
MTVNDCCGRKRLSGCAIDTSLERLGKTTENLSQNKRSLGRDSNSEPAEYEAGVLPTRPLRSNVPKSVQFSCSEW